MTITVIGEICEDVFIYGESNRLSPEAPVPVFKPIKTQRNSGMSGNVINNLLSIDKSLNIHCINQPELITKTRFVDNKSNHMFLRVDEGENNITKIKLYDNNIIDKIKESDAVIVSDYSKGFLSYDALYDISTLSKVSVIDSKSILSVIYHKYFDFIKLNEEEFNRNKAFVEKYEDKILVTLGQKGAMYMGEIFESPNPRETIDVSGAGDTFTAAFTLNYLKTNNIKESIIFANKMASIVVSKRGVTTPS